MGKIKSFSKYAVKKSAFEDWEAVFKNPKSIGIETLKTGTIVGKISGILNLKNTNAAQIKDGTANLPVLANIVRHQNYGDYLIDTGFDSSFSAEPGGNFKGLLKKVYFKGHYVQEDRSEGIEYQLKKRDIKLNGVFLTHIHEHASGLPSLPEEIPYVYGNGEGEVSFFPLVYSRFFRNKTNLQELDFSQGQEMPILGKCIDVFGDGSLWAIPTPGHTKGHISYLVNGRDALTLLAGDICVSRKGFELGIESGKYSMNIEEGRESFLRIKEFAKMYPFVKIIFGHENDEFKIDYK